MVCAIIAVVFTVQIVKANPTYFPVTVQTATATTTQATMTPGTGTTTLVYDSYASGSPRAASKATLLVQLVASSSPNTKLGIAYEFSQGGPGTNCSDTPLACDWFLDAGSYTFGFATTTKPFDIGQLNQYVWTYASTTLPGGVAGVTSTSTRAIGIPTPTRFTRVVITMIGTAGGSVWAQIVPQKETVE